MQGLLSTGPNPCSLTMVIFYFFPKMFKSICVCFSSVFILLPLIMVTLEFIRLLIDVLLDFHVLTQVSLGIELVFTRVTLESVYCVVYFTSLHLHLYVFPQCSHFK